MAKMDLVPKPIKKLMRLLIVCNQAGAVLKNIEKRNFYS